MTRERDIERVLDAWFEPGPSEMPDRLFDDVLARVDRLPQRRALPTLRFPAMNSRIRWLALAAAALVVAVAGLALINRPNNSDVGASPTPSGEPSPTPLAAIPAELQKLWIGETRQVPGLDPAAERSLMNLRTSRLAFDVGTSTILGSSVSLDAPGQIRFVETFASAGCNPDDQGVYTYELSAGGGTLTLAVTTDACAAREAAISGDWARSACPDVNSLCLGDLEAGAHVSVTFNPFVHVTDWVYDYGRFSYVVPDGWSNTVDGRNGYILAEQGAPDSAAIYLFATAYPKAQMADCSGSIDSSVGRSASAFASWLATLPGLVATDPAPVTVGGLSGMTLDLSVDPAWTGTCPFGGGEPKPFVNMLTNGETAEADNFDWGLVAGAGMRLFLLDLPDGRTMLIDVEAQTQADWSALVTAAAPVIDTFQFNP